MKRLSLKNWLLAPPYYGVPWIIWFYAVLSCLVMTQGGVFSGQLTGFDDHTRMVEVLNWVNGAGFYDRVITRVNAPEGFQTLWTRVVDIPFAIVILIGQQFTGQRQAALGAAFIVPLLELAVLFSVAPYFARPLVGKKCARLIILFLMFTTVMNYKPFSMSGFQTGEVSHHAWYIILVLLMFGAAARLAVGVISASPTYMMSLAITLLLSIGIEGLPLIAGAFLTLSLVALIFNRPNILSRLTRVAVYAALLSLLLLPLHQPPSQWFDISFAEPSILGPILMLLSAFFFVLQNFIVRCFEKNRALSFLGTLIAASVIGAGLVFALPQILAGPAAALSPSERIMAFKEHAEAWPLFRVAMSKVDFIGLVMPSVLAVGAALYGLTQTSSPRRRALYVVYFGFTVITSGMAEFIARYYHHAMTVASVWLLWAWQKVKSILVRNRSYALAALGAFVVLGPLWMLFLPALEQDVPWVSQVLLFPAKVQSFPDRCNSVAFGDYLNRHYKKSSRLLVPGADSSRMLFYSDLKIDFLNNYPSKDKFIDNETFFGTQDVDVAKDIALRHGVDLVAICRILSNLTPLKPGEEPMLYERLQNGQVPSWLTPIDTGFYGYHLYLVNKTLLKS